MSERKDGGPAFPCPHPSAPELGMSLRDYFAAAALQVIRHRLTINADAHDGGCSVDQIGESLCQGFVKTAYQVADAMIVERSK